MLNRFAPTGMIRAMLRAFFRVLQMTLVAMLLMQGAAQGLVLCICGDGEMVLEAESGPSCCDADSEIPSGETAVSSPEKDCVDCVDIPLYSASVQPSHAYPTPALKLAVPFIAIASYAVETAVSLPKTHWPPGNSIGSSPLSLRTTVLRV
jgi:hypothetical protein